jgi:hypothetical protein
MSQALVIKITRHGKMSMSREERQLRDDRAKVKRFERQMNRKLKECL